MPEEELSLNLSNEARIRQPAYYGSQMLFNHRDAFERVVDLYAIGVVHGRKHELAA